MPDAKSIAVIILLAATCGCSHTAQEEFDRGCQAFQDGNNAALHQSLKKLEERDSSSDYTLMLRALISERGGDYQTALQLMQQIDPDGPVRRLLLLHSGIIYHHVGMLAQSEQMLRVLTQEFPDDVDGHRWAGVVYYDLGAYDFAINHLNRVSELAPQDFRPLRLLAIMYCDFERNAEAIEVLERALTLEPPDAIRTEMVELLARSLISERRYTDALQILKAENAGPTSLAYRAECLLNLNDRQGAWEAIEQALALDDRNRAALLRKAAMLKVAGDRDEAIQVLRGLVEDDPYDAEVRYQYGLLLRAAGQTDAAEEQMQEWQRQKQLVDELTEKNVQALSRPFDTGLRLEIAEICDQLGKTELATMWRRVAAGTRASAAPARNQAREDRNLDQDQ